MQIAVTNPSMLKQLVDGGADVHKARGVIEKAVNRRSIESSPSVRRVVRLSVRASCAFSFSLFANVVSAFAVLRPA